MSNNLSNKSKQPINDRIARAIFAAAESVGISDRHLSEQLTEQVIQRLEQGQLVSTPALPGMEGLVQDKKGRTKGSPALEIEGIVKKTLTEMGHPEIAEAYLKEKKPLPKVVHQEDKGEIDNGNKEVTLQLSPNALRVLHKRYLKKDPQGKVIETPEDMFRRVAHSIAAVELAFNSQANIKTLEEKFYQLMVSMEFLPNSPTLMNAGRELGQLSACFVLPIEDSMESIFEAVKQTAIIHKSGGGTGFSFSRIRPENDRVGSTGGVASGPISFLRAFDIATDVIKQGGMRRGANMAILNVDHPDIFKFITAKEKSNAFTNFNFSVGITEDFMKAVERNDEYNLINPHSKQTSEKIKARDLFDKIIEMAWKSGDPGIIFLDRINRDNPTPKLGMIESTNPCGEQPLLPYESCNLGSINLSRMLCRQNGKEEIDYPKLSKTIHLAVRFLDNVIEANKFPTPKIEEMSKSTRKVGLGVMGFADALLHLNIPYNSNQALETAEKVMRFINDEALAASIELAEERGVFPAFKGSIYDIPGGSGVRNACRTTIAPTGTLSIIANCSSGIEPLFALSYTRTILEGEQLIEVNPYFEEVAKKEGFYTEELMRELSTRGTASGIKGIPERVQKVFVTAHDITPHWHVMMQAAFQKSTNNAVSKTVNFPHSATKEDVAEVFMLAYQQGCKGITIYRDRSKDSQVLSVNHDEDKGKEEKSKPEPLAPRTRGRITTGFTERVSTGCGHIYVTVNRDEQGICEVFSSLGKAGGCASAQLEAISRLISLSLRSGIEASSIAKHLRGIRCPSIAWQEGHAVLSCPDAIGGVLEKEINGNGTQVKAVEKAIKEESPKGKKSNGSVANGNVGLCPDCSNLLVYQEGCFLCHSCGYTKCG